MKRVSALLLALLLLCGCTLLPTEPTDGSTAPPTTTEPAQPETTQPTQTQPETTGAPTEGTTEPPVLYRSPLTGLPLDAPAKNRPAAVVINNIKAALPHHGVSQADMVYEILAEGGVTRCLALFSQLEDVEKIGSVRSARTYFIDLAQSYDALLVHAGGSDYAYKEFSRNKHDHLDGIRGGSSYCYRDKGRLSSGYALEHTLFTTGPKILAYAEKKNIPMTKDEIDYGLQFAEDATPDGKSAKKVTIHFRKGGKTTVMTLNPETGLYEAYQHKRDYIDGNTGSVMTFRNILVLEAKTSSDGYRVFADLVGSGKGSFACGGKLIPIRWSRESKDSPFVYTLEDGTPLTLGTGTSYIAIVPKGSPVDCQ